jgi:hypothetical protein
MPVVAVVTCRWSSSNVESSSLRDSAAPAFAMGRASRPPPPALWLQPPLPPLVPHPTRAHPPLSSFQDAHFDPAPPSPSVGGVVGACCCCLSPQRRTPSRHSKCTPCSRPRSGRQREPQASRAMCSIEDYNNVEPWPSLKEEGNMSGIIWRRSRNLSKEDGDSLLLILVSPNM